MTPKIDTQAHFVPAAYHAALVAHASIDARFARLVEPVLSMPPDALMRRVDEQRLADLDAAGCDVQVLSIVPPGATFGSSELAAEVAQVTNDALIAAAEPFGGRFLLLLTLPFPHIQESLAELDRVGRHPLVRGVSLPTSWDPWTLDNPALQSVYSSLADHGLVLVLHPAIAELPEVYDKWGLATGVGFAVSSTIASLRFALSGMLDRVPGLDVIVTHLGGAVPFLFQRVVERSGRGDAEHDLIHYWRERIWLDCCSNHLPSLQCAIDTVGADRIVLGSDYPPRARIEETIACIQAAGLSSQARDAILGRTAVRWFGPQRRLVASVGASKTPRRPSARP